MNYSVIKYLVGWVLCIEAGFMLIPLGVCLAYGEPYVIDYVIAMAIAVIPGILMCFRKPKNMSLYAKDGFVSVALSWIALSIAGAMPFWISGAIPSFVDALFEVISGFTTTGASILTNVEGLPKSMILWRSLTHWLGGMGVLVFLLAILPMTGGQSILIMRAESPGPSVGKLVPRLQQTAVYLYGIYLVLTVIEFVFLLCGGLNVFDSFCIAVGTAGTGGFGILNDSFMSYSSYIQVVVTVFMFLFGVNFNFYFFLLMRKAKTAFSIQEVRTYFIVILVAIGVITGNLLLSGTYTQFGESLKHAAFQCSSVMTTTGFSSADFDLWPELSKVILLLLMFSGGCAGSTCGGIKISRMMMYFKNIGREMTALIHPRTVKVIKMDGKAIDARTLNSTNMFLLTYAAIFIGSVLIVSINNFDFTTNFTAVLATLNNIGPGLAGVGPTRSFADFSILSKLVLMFDMLVGRLEIFPMLLLFSPGTWKK